MESQFGSLEGVIRTRVGYAGGTTPAPTYHSMEDHTEVVQLDYDPAVVSYEELLELFWNSHNPCAKTYGKQYRSLILYHSKKQLRVARKSMKQKSGIQTVLQPLKKFTLAEDYHQKYYLRQTQPFAGEMLSHYPKPRHFRDSPAASRLNGYLGGHGSRTQVSRDAERLGLSPTAQRVLKARYSR